MVSEATPESLNPSVLDEEVEGEEEEGLPSPPLDDLAFFYPHSSLELSEVCIKFKFPYFLKERYFLTLLRSYSDFYCFLAVCARSSLMAWTIMEVS